MPHGYRTIDPSETPWVEVYRRLTDVVVPRPIAWVSTVDAEGRPNLAPFSFFTVVSSNPPYLAFSPHRAGRTGAKKDTLRNIEATREFVVAVVTADARDKANASAATLPHGESEFDHAGVASAPAEVVRPSLVADSPVNMECQLVEIRTYGEEGGAGSLVVGKVVRMHLDERLLTDDGAVDPVRLRAVGRMGGALWVDTEGTFPMERP